jgi:superfamily II RNA helicase
MPLQAGDLVTLCRQVIDLLRQMALARKDDTRLLEVLQQATAAVDRDVVQVHL